MFDSSVTKRTSTSQLDPSGLKSELLSEDFFFFWCPGILRPTSSQSSLGSPIPDQRGGRGERKSAPVPPQGVQGLRGSNPSKTRSSSTSQKPSSLPQPTFSEGFPAPFLPFLDALARTQAAPCHPDPGCPLSPFSLRPRPLPVPRPPSSLLLSGCSPASRAPLLPRTQAVLGIPESLRPRTRSLLVTPGHPHLWDPGCSHLPKGPTPHTPAVVSAPDPCSSTS